jgi:hypothetical protein
VRWRGSSGAWTYGRVLERRDSRVRVVHGSGPHEIIRWLAAAEIEAVDESRFRWTTRRPVTRRRRKPRPGQLELGLPA